MANRYTKVIKTLKKDLSEAPTNSLGGLYQTGPVGRSLRPKDQGKLFYPDADGNWPTGVPGEAGQHYYYREPVVSVKGESDWNTIFKPDFTQDFLANSSTDTSNIIDPDTGTVKTFLPPNSRSFILGPLVDAWVLDHGYDAYSNIGYIQKDTRQFVLLGRVNGQFVNGLHDSTSRVWDGLESSFTAYNSSFTYSMAVWFRDQINGGNYVTNQPYFISGGTPQQPCTPSQCPNCPPNMYPGVTPGAAGGAGGSGGGNPGPTPNMGFGSGGDPKAGTEGNPPADPKNPEESGAPFPGANPKKKRGQGGRPGGSSGNRGGYGDDDGPEKGPDNPFRNNDRSRWPPDYAGDEKPKRGQGNRDTRNNPNRNRETPKAEPRTPERQPSAERGEPRRGQGNRDTRNNPNRNRPTPPSPTPRSPSPTPPRGESPRPTPRGQGNQPTRGNPNRQRQTPSNQRNAVERAREVIKRGVRGVSDAAIEQINKVSPDAGRAVAGVRDGVEVLSGVQDAIDKSRNQQLPPRQGSERPQLPPGTLGTKENPVTFNNFADTTLQDFAAGISPSDPPDLLKLKIERNILNRFNPGTKGTINNFNPESQPFFDANGDLNIPDTYAFDPGGDIADKPFLGTTVGNVAKALSLGSSEMEKDILTFFDKAGVATAPGRKDPMMHINIKVPAKFFKQTTKDDYTPKFIKGRTKQLNEDRYSKRQIRLLREIKQPVQIQEAPKKYKIDFSHKYQTPNTTSQQTDGLVAKANERGNRWRAQDKYWGGYESQERMNIIHDQTGHGKWYMDMLESKNQERVSWRDSEIQEQLNEIESQKAMKELYGESTTTEHEKNFDKVTKIKNVVSTQRSKDIAPEYPTDEPPEMIDGFHPDLVDGSKALAMYNRLNPKSADSMPKTAYPELDKKVSKAKSKKKDKALAEQVVRTEKTILESSSQFVKYYDWKTDEFAEPEMVSHFWSQIDERIEKLDDALSEGMTTKMFKDLYGIQIQSIYSVAPELVGSQYAQELITKSADVTQYVHGKDFPGSFINSIGDFEKPESLSKVDVKAHLAHADADKAAANTHTNHDFAYQATDYVLPTAEQMKADVTTVSSGDFFSNQMKQMIWPTYGQTSPLTGSTNGTDNKYFSYPWNDHVYLDNAYYEGLGYDMDNLTSTQQEKVIRERTAFVGGKYGGVSGTYHDDNHFLDITYGTARSIDETSFDIVGGAVYDWDDPSEFPNKQYLDLGPGWGWIYRSETTNTRYSTTKEHWQYQENMEDFYVSHLEDIIGIKFPAVKQEKYLDGDQITNIYLQPGGDDADMTDSDLPGDNDINTAGAYNECSAHKKIIQNAHPGDVITFDYRIATDQWDNTEGYNINGEGDGPYNDITGEPNELYVIAGKRIMKAWSLYKELPDSETTIDYGFVLRNTESAIDTGTFKYVIQKEDINPTTGALDFVTAYHADDLYFGRVSITNFAVNEGKKSDAGSVAKTTAAYDLGYSVFKSEQTKKKREEEGEEEGNLTSTTGGGVEPKTDVEVEKEREANENIDPDQKSQDDSEIESDIQDSNEEIEKTPTNQEEEDKLLEDLDQEEQEEDKEIEQEKESDEVQEEKDKFLEELEGDEETTEEQRNIFSDIFDKVIDYAAEITGHRTSKAFLDIYNKFLKYGTDVMRGDGYQHWKNHVYPGGKPGWTPGKSPLFYMNREGEVNLNNMDLWSREDFQYLRSALNDSEMERIHAKAMNANNEKSKHLYLHALGDRVESQVQNYILANKGLRNSLFQGVKLDRDAFLQSNGKYISFTKDYKFRPGGSVAEAEKSWAGKLLTGLGFKLDTLGSGNIIDKIGGLLAGKLLDGTDDLYNAPAMPMRFSLHRRGSGNTSYLPYEYGTMDKIHTDQWWEEDREQASRQEHNPRNWTPETINWYYVLNPRTQEWERPVDENGEWTSGRYGRDYEGRTAREYALSVKDEFWWLDPDFVDLSGYGQEKEQQEDPTDNVYDELSATDAATLVAMQRKKKKRGQGGRKLGDTTKRGGKVNEWTNWIMESRKHKERKIDKKKLERKRIAKLEKDKMRAEKAMDLETIRKNQPAYPGQPSASGWPDQPPSPMDQSGMAVDMFQRADRYKRLDPISAKEMSKVKTGVPDIDKLVKTQANQPKYPKDANPGEWRKSIRGLKSMKSLKKS